jgi:hypothetical protein
MYWNKISLSLCWLDIFTGRLWYCMSLINVCCFNMMAQVSTWQLWRSIILILSCAGSSLALLLGACVKNAMGSVSSVTRMCVRVRLSGSAMSATTVHSREGVLSAEVLAFQTRTTARNALSRRRTGMGALRLSTLEVPRLISFTSVRNMVLRRDDDQDDVFVRFLWPHVTLSCWDRCIVSVLIRYWYEDTPDTLCNN